VLSYDNNGSTAAAFSVNPFVGLRPFRSDEGLLFFGRREQTFELLHQLQQSRFLSVVGSSGCGKSSLIRAGLIPKLQAGFIVEQRDQWRIATAKPGDAPLLNLAQSLVKTFSDGSSSEDVAALCENMKTECTQAVVEFLTTRLKESDANLLLLIDQFEEVFTFGRYGQREIAEGDDTRSKEVQVAERLEREGRRDEAADYVSIMLGLAAQTELPVYVVMTMRSDFLGDCDVFYGLPEAINESQYLVPRLARPQRQEAIENPIRLYGQTISQRLLDRILNDAGEEADQLPVMQHAMMRTWEKWKASGDPVIDLEHYEAAGAMKHALSNDAEEALSGMSAEDLSITKKLFQALTDNDPRGRRIRRPTHLAEIQAITGASREKLLEIISHFSGHGRSFLQLSQEDSDPLVDISHESLIRQWNTLRNWVTKESRSKEIYLRLVGTAIRYYKEKPEDELIRGAALQLALDWREKRKPNQAWANRYHPGLDLALKFLDESKTQRDRDIAEAERQRNAEIERERRDLENAQRMAEAEAAARKKELDAALELATQRESAARWQRRAIYGLVFLLVLALGTTAFAVRAGIKANERKKRAEEAERTAKDLSEQLKGTINQLNESLGKEKKLQGEIAAKFETEQRLKREAEKLRDEAKLQAAFANKQARLAIAAARREKAALKDLVIARDRAEAAAIAAANNAKIARNAEVEAIRTQQANHTFREGLTLARTNNRKAAADKYSEAATLYKSLTEPDSDGEASTYLELADLYFQSEDSKLLKEGMDNLEKAQDIFKEIKNENGNAACSIKMGDFFTSNSILQDAVGSEADYFRYASVVMYMQAFESYKEAKNLPGMAATSDKLADLSRTSNDSEYLSIILAIYEELLTFYTERNYAPEKVSLYLKLGETHNRLKKTEEAKKDFENALKVYADFGDDEGKEAEARTYVDIGFVLGEENEIKSHVDQAMVAVRKMNNPIAEANTLRYIGNKLQRRWQMGPTSRPEFASEPKRAADYYAQALTLYQRSPESRINQAETLTDLGTINLQIDKSAALDHFQKAYDLYTDKEDSQRASLLFNIGLIQEANGQWDAALKSFKEAESKFGDADFIEQLRASRAVERVKAAQVKSGAKP
jgi:uncharacterized protein YoxC/energy-coupling factor transporter ATP-binding protein EcfA2